MVKKKYTHEVMEAEEKNKVQLPLMLLSLFLYL